MSANNLKATLGVIALSFAAAGLAHADNGRSDELGKYIAFKNGETTQAASVAQVKAPVREQVQAGDSGRADGLGIVITAKNQTPSRAASDTALAVAKTNHGSNQSGQ
jgi:hypothetical protein